MNNKQKIAILGDTHIGLRGGNDIFHYHLEDFFNNVFFPELKKRNIQEIIHLGDVFDKRKHIDISCFYKSRKYFFDILRKNNINMTICIGNHDIYYKNTNDVNSPDQLLREYDNINIISKPKELNIGSGVLFLPWINDENEEETIKKIKESKSKIVIGHLEINGYQMYKGLVATHGHSKTLFSKFDKVFTGHFHHKNSKDNIHYLGTPVQYTWADEPDTKGFHIWDTETNELEFIKNPNNVFHFFSPFDNEDPNSVRLTNCFVKIIIKNDKHEENLDEYIKLLEKINVHSIEVIDNRNMDVEIKNIDISETDDTIDIVKKHIKNMENDYPDLNVLLEDLYKRALEC